MSIRCLQGSGYDHLVTYPGITISYHDGSKHIVQQSREEAPPLNLDMYQKIIKILSGPGGGVGGGYEQDSGHSQTP